MHESAGYGFRGTVLFLEHDEGARPRALSVRSVSNKAGVPTLIVDFPKGRLTVGQRTFNFVVFIARYIGV